MTHTQPREEVPFPFLMNGFSKIIELEEGLWEITDDKGESVFATHCQLTSCGQPMFSKRIRMFYVCPECVLASSRMRNKREVYRETRRCFCGNEFEWSTSMKKRRYCSRTCCARAAWRMRKHRI